MSEKMTQKERVLASIEMRPADRLPRDFHACDVVLQRLYQHFCISDYKQLLEKLNSDIVDIRGIVDPEWIAPHPQKIKREDGSLQNHLGFITKLQNTVFGPVMEHSDYILKNCTDLSEIQQFQFPKVEWFDFSSMSRRLEKYSDFAVMASGASVFQHPTLVRQMDMLLCDMLLEPEIANYIMDKYTDFYCDYFNAMFKACPGQIDILRIADDLGMQDSPLISNALFDEFCFPRIKRLTDLAHSHGVKVMFHSCGAVSSFIDRLIEAGIDILDPLQPNANNMAPEVLSAKYAGKICFHGSIDTQYTLPMGTPEDVRAQARKHTQYYTKNQTGFIISPAHTLQPDVKTENIIALYDEIDRISDIK